MALVIFLWPSNTPKNCPLSFPTIISWNFELKGWTSQKKEEREAKKGIPLANLATLCTSHSEFARKPCPHRSSSSSTVVTMHVPEDPPCRCLKSASTVDWSPAFKSVDALQSCRSGGCCLNHSNQASLQFLGFCSILWCCRFCEFETGFCGAWTTPKLILWNWNWFLFNLWCCQFCPKLKLVPSILLEPLWMLTPRKTEGARKGRQPQNWFCIFLGTSKMPPRTRKIPEKERRGRKKLRARKLKHI